MSEELSLLAKPAVPFCFASANVREIGWVANFAASLQFATSTLELKS
jgi:hypothetical protein